MNMSSVKSAKSADLPPVNEAVAFLSAYAPNTLEALQNKYSDLAKKFLTPGNVVLGGPSSERELQLRAEVALRSLKEVRLVCVKLIPITKAKIKSEKQLRFAGQVLTTLASSSVIAAIATRASDTAKMGAAVITLIASLCTLFADRVSGTIQGDLHDHFKTLIEGEVKSEALSQEMEVWINSGYSGDDGLSTIKQCNDLCQRIKIVASQVA